MIGIEGLAPGKAGLFTHCHVGVMHSLILLKIIHNIAKQT